MSRAPTIRPATEADLPSIWRIRWRNDVGDRDPPPTGQPPSYLSHLVAHGTLLVAERGGAVVGYAGATVGDDIAYLADLFVDPACQSSEVGQHLLAAALPPTGHRCTLASVDPRAIALYARAGMAPRWPNLLLELDTASAALREPPGGLRVVETAIDEEFAAHDSIASGRARAVDLGHLVEGERGVALRVEQDGHPRAVAIVRFAAGRLWHPEAVTVGPISVLGGDEADAVLAIVRWAADRGTFLEIAVPGPHPALSVLLRARFRITYVETYCASLPGLVNPTRYIGSGGDLF